MLGSFSEKCIGNRLRKLREANNMTQQETMKKIGYSSSKKAYVKMSRMENGDTLSLREIVLLAELFGVSTDYILTGVEAERLDAARDLGLSDDAIKRLAHMRDRQPWFSEIASALIEDPAFITAFYNSAERIKEALEKQLQAESAIQVRLEAGSITMTYDEFITAMESRVARAVENVLKNYVNSLDGLGKRLEKEVSRRAAFWNYLTDEEQSEEV